VRCADRARVRDALEASGVGSSVYYPKPIHRLEAYEDEGFEASAPVAERAAEEVLSVPVHPGVDEADLDRVAEALAGVEVTAA